MKTTLKALRRQAISGSLLEPTTLLRAVEQLGFVQADPIRSPARAQDLILRQRVTDYRAGDIEREYPSLDFEEDFLYAYGFMPRSTWRLLHPRVEKRLSATEQRVLDIVSAHKLLHPRELEVYLGRKRRQNAWGGYSKTTTIALQRLHYRGILRVGARENGIRLYEPSTQQHDHIEPNERLRQLVLLIASILGPLSDRSLRAALRHLAYAAPSLEGRRLIVTKLIDSGDLANAIFEDVRYVWPAARATEKTCNATVRFLAPFDPVVWDRRRFEHLWQWAYRFEAYTPLHKRQLGYYAMPILWREDMIGWVNVSKRAGELIVEPGFKKEILAEPAFRKEFEAEFERLRLFLRKRDDAATERRHQAASSLA